MTTKGKTVPFVAVPLGIGAAEMEEETIEETISTVEEVVAGAWVEVVVGGT